MRPHDVVVLCKIIIQHQKEWQNRMLAESLFISSGEISESLNRSRTARLIDHNKKMVNKASFYEFLLHGLPFVFPGELGALQRGIATAHSHNFMKQYFDSNTNYIWPDYEGSLVGLALKPLYENQTKAVKFDAKLYEVLALIDVLRIGKVREIEVAKKEIHKIFFDAK